ncbi:ribonuclease H-like domain-containing protein [Tanacetum coccineum]
MVKGLSRKIIACTHKFLSKGIVDQVEKNPDIPIRALQEELQRKYELGVSRQKAFRAKAAALNQVKGDYRQQYTMLRDYCLEGQGKIGENHWPTTLTPPKHNTPVGRPRKNRRKSKEENAEMVKDGKLSRAYKIVTCMKCGNLGHNSRSCKGQKDP